MKKVWTKRVLLMLVKMAPRGSKTVRFTMKMEMRMSRWSWIWTFYVIMNIISCLHILDLHARLITCHVVHRCILVLEPTKLMCIVMMVTYELWILQSECRVHIEYVLIPTQHLPNCIEYYRNRVSF